MMVCGLVGMAIVVACVLTAALLWSWLPLALIFYLSVIIRVYESAVSDARSAYTHLKLLLLPAGRMDELIAARKVAMASLVPAMDLLDPSVVEEINLNAFEAAPSRSKLEAYLPWFIYRLADKALQRTKRDWNEVLRLQDHATMDYIQ